MGPVGAGDLNAVLGTDWVALAATSPAGVLIRWQLSHFELFGEGMCAVEPVGLVGGKTTMLVMP